MLPRSPMCCNLMCMTLAAHTKSEVMGKTSIVEVQVKISFKNIDVRHQILLEHNSAATCSPAALLVAQIIK